MFTHIVRTYQKEKKFVAYSDNDYSVKLTTEITT